MTVFMTAVALPVMLAVPLYRRPCSPGMGAPACGHLVADDREVADQLPGEPGGVVDDAVGEQLAGVDERLHGAEPRARAAGFGLLVHDVVRRVRDDLAPEGPVLDEVVVLLEGGGVHPRGVDGPQQRHITAH